MTGALDFYRLVISIVKLLLIASLYSMVACGGAMCRGRVLKTSQSHTRNREWHTYSRLKRHIEDLFVYRIIESIPLLRKHDGTGLYREEFV